MGLINRHLGWWALVWHTLALCTLYLLITDHAYPRWGGALFAWFGGIVTLILWLQIVARRSTRHAASA